MEFHSYGLTGPQGMLIGILFHHGELTVSELSRKMGLSLSTVSGIIDRLEETKLIERKRSKEDRRVVKVSLTKEFKNRATSKHKIIENHLEKAIRLASDEELKIILEGLKTLELVINRSNEKEND